MISLLLSNGKLQDVKLTKPRNLYWFQFKRIGNGIIDGEVYSVNHADNFILTSDDLDTVFEGELEVIISYM